MPQDAHDRELTAEDRDRTGARDDEPQLEEGILDAELPADMRAAFARLVDAEQVGSLGEWVAEVRRATGGGAIAIHDLCHARNETAHWGDMDGERYHFACFFDAIILAAMTDEPVDIRTESPDGTVIEARAAGTGALTVNPEESVASFGIDEDVERPVDGDVSHDDVYAAICPYVRAFPGRDAYERWAESVEAATVVVPMRAAPNVAVALVA